MEKPPDHRDDDPARRAGPSPAPADPALRRLAEERARQTAAVHAGVSLSPEATRRMLHELRVHQIELEMQNEELRRAQAELDASRALYFDLYDLAPVGYCTVNGQGLILQANLTAAALFGVSRRALAMQPIGGVIFKADQDVYYLCRQQLMASGEAQTCELRMVKSDGTPFWVQLAATAAPGADGDSVTRIVLTDIGERKLTEAAMREREARYRAIVEWSPEAIAVHRGGKIIYANAAALRLFGTTHSQDLIGQPVLDRVHPDFHPIVQARMKGLTQDNAAAPMVEMLLLKLDGTSISAEVQSIRTVFDGEPAIQAALHDVTERVRLGQLLQARNSELESAKSAADKANQAKSEFLSRMSHELRTPLSAILGFAQLLESATPAPTISQKRGIDQILQAGWYLLDLINEILDLAQIESGKLSLALEPVPLADVLQECRAMVEPLAQQHAVGLALAEIGIGYFVEADRKRMKQIFINLLSNAIKYNREGGTVLVDCVATTPEHIRISVRDSGKGLTPDQLGQLFQPFNRLGHEASAAQGTGIGLVVCKRLITLMGGVIGVESTVGTGSVFWIEMKLCAAPQAMAGAPEQATRH